MNRVLAVTFPKSGTNLLIQWLGSPEHIGVSHNLSHEGLNVITGNPATAANEMTMEELEGCLRTFPSKGFGHVPYHPRYVEAIRSKPTCVIFLIRDPRDVIVSHYHYVKGYPDASMNYRFPDDVLLADRPDPILDLIELSSRKWLLYLPWMSDANLVMNFEMMIDAPEMAASLLLHVCGAHALSVTEVEEIIARGNPSISPTFREGKVGAWKEEFKHRHIRAYWKWMEVIHESLGYEL